MVRRGLLAAVVAGLGVAVSACGGGSKPHTQGYSPAPTASASSSAADSSSPSASGSADLTTTPPDSPGDRPVNTPSHIPAPSVAPSGQAAVNAYISLVNLTDALDVDPAHADVSKLRPYVTAASFPQWRQIYRGMAANHLAYKGTPDDPHIKVVGAGPSSVALSNCPTPAATNPAVQYDVRTGKVVGPTHSSGPYLKAITVLLVDGHWRVDSISTNTSKPCKP
jgi:hypothetical protein